MRLNQVWVNCWLLALIVEAATAATFRVDDSASIPHEPSTTMHWKSLAPGRTAGNAVEGASLVTVRLNLAPWHNKSGKIYMVLPELPLNQVKIEWNTQGKLLAGRLVSGSRALVYDGVISALRIEDTFAIRIETDGRQLNAPQRLQFYFEIDVE